MMRRISLAVAAAAMLALSALPASAATMGSSTHKLSFPVLSGVKAWGTYAKTSKGVKINICAEGMSQSIFSVGSVAVASNSTGKMKTNLGAVAMYHEIICRSMTLHLTSHLQTYLFTLNNKGMIVHKTKMKKIY